MRHGLRWQGGSRDTAFGRTNVLRFKEVFRACEKRRGAALPAAVHDTPGLQPFFGKVARAETGDGDDGFANGITHLENWKTSNIQ